MTPLTIGFSPCPNDTFIFNKLVHSAPQPGEPLFADPCLEDVETLNQWAFEKRLDITKLSYHAAGHLLDDYCLLPSGGALGRGCGPLLVSRENCHASDLIGKKNCHSRQADNSCAAFSPVSAAMHRPGGDEI